MTSTEYRLFNNDGLVSDNVLSEIEHFVTDSKMTASECLNVLKLMNEYLLCRAYNSMLKNLGNCSINSYPEIGVYEGFEYLYSLYSDQLSEQCDPDFDDFDDFKFSGEIKIKVAIGSHETDYDNIEDFIYSVATSGLWILIDRISIKWKDVGMTGYASFDSDDIQSIVRRVAL